MNKKKNIPLTPASEKESAFWYCMVPEKLKKDADVKRMTVKASKVSVMLRFIRWYLRPETEA